MLTRIETTEHGLIWTGAMSGTSGSGKSGAGYPTLNVFTVDGKRVDAKGHIIWYEITSGEQVYGSGKIVRHLCENTRCLSHLKAGTARENGLDIHAIRCPCCGLQEHSHICGNLIERTSNTGVPLQSSLFDDEWRIASPMKKRGYRKSGKAVKSSPQIDWLK